ncbi:MAG: DUF6132 family protein [Moheibacter sp.]
MEFIKKHILVISGMLIGALAGFLYWRFVGCVSGTCAITSNPVNSTIYGFVTGGLIFSIFKKDEKKFKKAEENEISGDH